METLTGMLELCGAGIPNPKSLKSIGKAESYHEAEVN